MKFILTSYDSKGKEVISQVYNIDDETNREAMGESFLGFVDRSLDSGYNEDEDTIDWEGVRRESIESDFDGDDEEPSDDPIQD